MLKFRETFKSNFDMRYKVEKKSKFKKFTTYQIFDEISEKKLFDIKSIDGGSEVNII